MLTYSCDGIANIHGTPISIAAQRDTGISRRRSNTPLVLAIGTATISRCDVAIVAGFSLVDGGIAAQRTLA